MAPSNPMSNREHRRPLSWREARHDLLQRLRYGGFWPYVWGQLLISRRCRFWPVALALLPAILGIPGWLETPWWSRPIVLASIAGVAFYGQARSEYEQERRSERERLAFANEARNLFSAEARVILGEARVAAAERRIAAEREEIAALEGRFSSSAGLRGSLSVISPSAGLESQISDGKDSKDAQNERE